MMIIYGDEYRSGRKATWWEQIKRRFRRWAERYCS